MLFQNGDSPLHIAAAMGRRKLVRILLEAADIDTAITNQQKETAVEIARRKMHREIAEIIAHPPPKPERPQPEAAAGAEMLSPEAIDGIIDDLRSVRSGKGRTRSKDKKVSQMCDFWSTCKIVG